MKLRILKAAALLILLSNLASCARALHTDNRRGDHHHYRRGGRAW